MGIGALGGVLVAGALATQLDVPSSTDVLAIDLSALLGGLTGAALGTPVLVSQDESPARDRIWLSGIMLGTVAGAGLSYWITQSGDDDAQAAASSEPGASTSGVRFMPQIGWMGRPLGFGVAGSW
jgi:ABC-type enterobactin transport system permease subunit